MVVLGCRFLGAGADLSLCWPYELKELGRWNRWFPGVAASRTTLSPTRYRDGTQRNNRCHLASVAKRQNNLTENPVRTGRAGSPRTRENVLDLFGGSGSTLIAAQQTGRREFLMELDPL